MLQSREMCKAGGTGRRSDRWRAVLSSRKVSALLALAYFGVVAMAIGCAVAAGAAAGAGAGYVAGHEAADED